MLSILIPIYNWYVDNLIKEIVLQSNQLMIPYEIICIDDNSLHEYKLVNRNVFNDTSITYIELENNVGRPTIRNLLAEKSIFQHLLFLDCDCTIENPIFIDTYIDNIRKNRKAVLLGGRIYSNTRPKDSAKILHWQYGRNREALAAIQRNRRAYEMVHTNNVVIPKKILIQIPFDSSIQGYGYEDLEWAARLEKKDIPLLHIDNAVRHDGLKKENDYIADVIHATSNLAKLFLTEKVASTRLIRTYLSLKKWHLHQILPSLTMRLLSVFKIRSLQLARLDSIKLYYFAKEIKKLQ